MEGEPGSGHAATALPVSSGNDKNVNQKKMKKIGATEIFIELKDKTITLILSDQDLENQTH